MTPLPDLKELWKTLGDVPVLINAAGVTVLDEPFQQFIIGTDIEDVWHWFEAQNPAFRVIDMMFPTRRLFKKIAACAQRLYCDDSNNDIELVNDPVRDITEDGAWVEAWLWVPAAAYEEDDDE